MELSLGVPKKHKPKRAVKSLVASNFYVDGNLFIEVFDNIKKTDSMQHRNFRAKAIVDLAMSLECSLKSLVISLSKDSESPNDAYKKARKCSHDLRGLYEEVASRAKNRLAIKKINDEIFNDLKSLKVGSRYSFEVFLLRFQADKSKVFIGEDLISRTIDNPEWVSRLRSEAVTINKLAEQCHSKYLSKHAILSGAKFKKFDKELSNFLSSLR
ncbi:hypothetical protein QU487_04755 [Crenobacter sp. SG2305]|uniref:hypothetical protein n=1 Tax=Crenobacter oryzisoli TaxID=3056844 RepID=UPI0025AA4DB3|nr:hypothetical protein [Crenobacter sp. SG2305]MDN0082064.1 hypothetical protein [Crenobacter sp. SG2305]